MLPLSSTNVLVCLRFGIGDVVMELPALTALRRALPDARITAIASAPAHELLAEDPRVDRVVVTSRWGLRHRWDGGTADQRAQIAAWVRAQTFDLVLDARHATAAVGRAIWSLGIRSLEADLGEEERAIAAGESGVEAIRAGVRAGWGLEVPTSLRPELRLRPADRAFADAFFRGRTIEEAPVAISPVASHEMKRWPADRFAALTDQVVRRSGGPVLVLEGPQSEHGRQVVEALERPDAAVRVGAYPLLQTAALLARCRALVCNDTGLMHVAGAVGTPTVGVFGPTRAALFLPPGNRAIGAEPPGLECPHRVTTSLYPPECWRRGRCLIAERSCIHGTRFEDVRSGLESLLERRSFAGPASGVRQNGGRGRGSEAASGRERRRERERAGAPPF